MPPNPPHPAPRGTGERENGSRPPVQIGSVVLFGKAIGQGSKRIGRRKDGRPLVLDASPHARPWRNDLTLLMREQRPERPYTGAVFMALRVFVPRPAAHFGSGRNAGTLKANAPLWPVTGIDLDKIQRAVGDAGTAAGWWRDDRQIFDWMASRIFADDGQGERTEVDAWVFE